MIKVSLNYAYIIILPKITQYIIKPFIKNDVKQNLYKSKNNKLYIYNIVIYILYRLLQLSLILIMKGITKLYVT